MPRWLRTTRKFTHVLAGVWLSGCTTLGLAALNIGNASSSYDITTAAYGDLPSQKLDIYQPRQQSDGPRDVVFFLYGGAWETGSKDDYGFLASRFVQQGFVVVIPDYRKYPEVKFPAFVDDAGRALAWTSDHVAQYGGKPTGIHILGHSAGGHIGALLVTDRHYLAQNGKNTNEVIGDFTGLAGPYDFVPAEKDYIDMFGPPERYPLMQATTFVDGNEVPMLLLWGQKDDTVAAHNYEKFSARIKEKGGRVTVITYPNLGHIGILTTITPLGPDSTVFDDTVNFMKQPKN